MEFHLKIEKHHKADEDINVDMSRKYVPVQPAFEGAGRLGAYLQLNILFSC